MKGKSLAKTADSGQAGMTGSKFYKAFYEFVKNGTIVMLLSLLSLSVPLYASAVSYPAQLYHHEERRDKFVKGDTLYLFHSGTPDVRKTIHVNDTLAVYRTSPSCEVTPIGIIRVISFVGDTYIRGEVFAGEIRPDDIAKKDNVSCLVISAEICDK